MTPSKPTESRVPPTGCLALALPALLLLAACARAGEIAGTLKPADRVLSARAIDRETKKTFAADVDRQSGKYHFKNLPRGTYDIILETSVGRIEGVNLKVDQAGPKRQSMTLEPSELDKGEITTIAGFLAGLVKDRAGKTPTVEWLCARVRQTKMREVYLGKDRFDPDGSEASVKVPLKDDERPQVSDMLLGLISLVRVRDQLPRDFDLVIVVDVQKHKVGEIRIVPVPPELTEKDRKWLIDWVDKLKIFENKKRVLDLDGTGDRARVLVEKLRDRPTTLPAKEPTAFWRVEIFHFQKYYGGWNKEKYTVIVRQRVPIRKLRTYRWMFEKRLGGIRVAADAVTDVTEYEVPSKLDPARGRVPY
ncbi:MAG: hypothetical protein AMS16_00840 [Planctomycetes bacterium DG_58]|nr:MAG: hypothetical protein AMS16_00840 [Planctomycetes bacterium DG_58]